MARWDKPIKYRVITGAPYEVNREINVLADQGYVCTSFHVVRRFFSLRCVALMEYRRADARERNA